jgi:sugar phosphate isomerase/epimerase
LPELKIAVAISCLRQPIKKALHTVARLGATGIEIDARNGIRPSEISDTGRRQLRKMLTDLNLTVAAVRFPTRRGYDVVHDLDRRLEATKQTMSFAYSLGATVVINAIGYIPEDAEHPANVQLRASLTDLARHGEKVGAILACETGTEPVSRLVKLIGSITSGSLGIHFNPANLILADHYDQDAIRLCAPMVRSVSIRDAVRDLAQRRGIEVEIGRGSAEFPEILGVLEEQGYRGWFIVDRPPSSIAESEISDAISLLRSF